MLLASGLLNLWVIYTILGHRPSKATYRVVVVAAVLSMCCLLVVVALIIIARVSTETYFEIDQLETDIMVFGRLDDQGRTVVTRDRGIFDQMVELYSNSSMKPQAGIIYFLYAFVFVILAFLQSKVIICGWKASLEFDGKPSKHSSAC